MVQVITSHRDLKVYQQGFDSAMKLFEASRQFPVEERYSLTDQIRRSSRSVCTNVAEAWRKRRYAAAWVSKLSDAEGEAAETQVWIHFAVKCGYIDRDFAAGLYWSYEGILKMIVSMINRPDAWTIGNGKPRR